MTLFVQGLTADEVAKCKDVFPGEVVSRGAEGSFIEEWKQRAGDLTITTDEDDLLVVKGEGLGVVGSVVYAVSRRRIPVLTFELDTTKIGLESDFLECGTEFSIEAVRGFVTPAATPGKIFTMEGADGAGKQTQAARLVARLHENGYPVRTMDFPRDDAAYGKKIREILSGKHGSISEVSPLLFATVYSFNRDDLRPLIKHWLRKGYNVILDRFMESSYGHQAAKLDTPEEKAKMIGSLEAYETKWLGIPASSAVLYLDLDPQVAMKAMQQDGTRKELDIHEKARANYKESVRACFRWCCEHFAHWQEMPQQTEDGARKTRDTVSDEIWTTLETQFVNKSE